MSPEHSSHRHQGTRWSPGRAGTDRIAVTLFVNPHPWTLEPYLGTDPIWEAKMKAAGAPRAFLPEGRPAPLNKTESYHVPNANRRGC